MHSASDDKNSIGINLFFFCFNIIIIIKKIIYRILSYLGKEMYSCIITMIPVAKVAWSLES